MNRTLMFGIAAFLALVGIAMLMGFDSPLVAGGRCCGCSGGCHGCSGCYGCHGCSGCYGCHGCSGCYGCHGCSGCYGCHGCSGCYGCHGCSGGVIVVPATPATPEKKAEAKPLGFREVSFRR